MSTELTTVNEHQGSQSGSMAIATTRQAQEVQAAMVVAKRFPRDETAAISKITKSCKRPSLAEVAIYSYPKGKTKVEGPSIRLAEAMAQAWGNIDFGWLEIETNEGESKVMAYAHDLESNTRRQQIFSVPHVRGTRSGNVLLTDPRDIYEMCANQAARRMRACILSVIPGDVQDLAVSECEKTLRGTNSEPIEDRVRKMLMGFKDQFSVTKEMIEARLGYNVEAFTEHDLVGLRKIFMSIKDGIGKREDFFDISGKSTPTEEVEKQSKSRADAAQSAMASTEKKKPKPKEEPPESEPEPVSEESASDFEHFKSAIAASETMKMLESIVKKMQTAKVSSEEMEQLGNLYDDKMAELDGPGS